MLKKVLKTVALVSAMAVPIASLLVSCSQNPAQVKTMGQNNLNIAAVTAGVAQKAKAISSFGYVHIIGTTSPNNVYRWKGGAWNVFTRKITSTKNLPSTLTYIAVSQTNIYDSNTCVVYVLGSDSRIYSYTSQILSNGFWTEVPQGTNTAIFAKDICVGGHPEDPYDENLYLWKIGKDNKLYRYYGGSFHYVQDAPSTRDAEYPRSGPIGDRLVMDVLGNGFVRQNIQYIQGAEWPWGHIQWACSPWGKTHDDNVYNTNGTVCEGNDNPALDIYGVKQVSLIYTLMSFATLDGGNWSLWTISMNDCRKEYNLNLSDNQKIQMDTTLTTIKGVTCNTGAAGTTNATPWVIATDSNTTTHAVYHRDIVWKSTLLDDQPMNKAVKWTIP